MWVRSSAGGWYVTILVPATGTAGTVYSAALPLASVPAGLGNEVIVSYRPVAGTGAFMSWATSPGNFSVDAIPPSLTVTDPTGGSYTQGTTLTVTWSDARADGEYGVWLYGGGTWYYSQLVAANGAASDSATVTLSVPPGSGYQAVIAYRPNIGTGAFVAWATSPGYFAVTP